MDLRFLISLLAGFLLWTGTVTYSAMPIYNPKPPEKNPHPAESDIDKKRVKFAVESVKKLLTDENFWENQKIVRSIDPYRPKDQKCIEEKNCVTKDKHFIMSTQNIYRNHGVVLEMKHPHIIPWAFKNFERSRAKFSEYMPADMVSKEAMSAPKLNSNEYMVHIYAKFSQDAAWYHLDVIIEEDKDGKLFLKYFFVAPFYDSSGSLPPGVVC